jgi:hypothetical protein
MNILAERHFHYFILPVDRQQRKMKVFFTFFPDQDADRVVAEGRRDRRREGRPVPRKEERETERTGIEKKSEIIYHFFLSC